MPLPLGCDPLASLIRSRRFSRFSRAAALRPLAASTRAARRRSTGEEGAAASAAAPRSWGRPAASGRGEAFDEKDQPRWVVHGLKRTMLARAQIFEAKGWTKVGGDRSFGW